MLGLKCLAAKTISKSILKSPEEIIPVPACPAQARINSVAPSTHQNHLEEGFPNSIRHYSMWQISTRSTSYTAHHNITSQQNKYWQLPPLSLQTLVPRQEYLSMHCCVANKHETEFPKKAQCSYLQLYPTPSKIPLPEKPVFLLIFSALLHLAVVLTDPGYSKWPGTDFLRSLSSVICPYNRGSSLSGQSLVTRERCPPGKPKNHLSMGWAVGAFSGSLPKKKPLEFCVLYPWQKSRCVGGVCQGWSVSKLLCFPLTCFKYWTQQHLKIGHYLLSSLLFLTASIYLTVFRHNTIKK